MNLTEEQKAIVEHVEGPALVFAVAGSGKTTAMVHRIAHLIKHLKVKPEKILATTYSKEGSKDLVDECNKIGITENVYIRTLHSFSLGLINRAIKMNLISSNWKKAESDEENMLIFNAMKKIANEENKYVNDLDIDEETFKEKLCFWKSNLFFPDILDHNYSNEILKEIKNAEDSDPVYLKAYQYYEEERIKGYLLTFDDMLVQAWLILKQYPAILNMTQNGFDHVLVDEFQDVNFVQYKILDLITMKKKNYMAIGDDDQCIYEWRGASSRFILDFEKTYKSKTYTITDNFRCKAKTVAIANNVIGNNKNRYKKTIQLTQGFSGNTFLTHSEGSNQISKDIYGDIQARIAEGSSIDEMVILIRTYAQTPFIENIFIENNFPYQIVGDKPFYKRQDALILFSYLRWLKFEWEIKKGYYPNKREEMFNYIKYFKDIINKPNRFLSRSTLNEICDFSMNQKRSVLNGLTLSQDKFKKGTLDHVKKFIQLCDALENEENTSTSDILSVISEQIGYKNYIIEKCLQPEVGELKARIVDAVIDFSLGKGNVKEFLDYLNKITFNRPEEEADPSWFKIMTIFKAKGLEWKHVFIPDCNQGIIPLLKQQTFLFMSDNTEQNKLEEERRLFYVALTRAKENVYLYVDTTKTISQFITEANINIVVRDIDVLFRSLNKLPEELDVEDVLLLVKTMREYEFKRYFQRWWKCSNEYKTILLKIIATIENNLLANSGQIENYKNKLQIYENELKKYNDHVNQIKVHKRQLNDKFKGQRIQVLLNKNIQGDTNYRDQIISFKKESNSIILALINDKIVGKVHVNTYENETIDDFKHVVGKTGKYAFTSQTGKSIYVFLDEQMQENVKIQLKKPEMPKPLTNEIIRISDSQTLIDLQFLKSILLNEIKS